MVKDFSKTSDVLELGKKARVNIPGTSKIIVSGDYIL